MSGVPDQAQATRKTSERLRNKREETKNDPAQGMAHGSEESVENQIIIAPEIMRIVLEQLDVRALKKVRLVCKSWLLEAQSHMEERGIVWLGDFFWNSTRLQEFDETRKKKILALPQPFKSLDLDLDVERQALPQKPVLRLLSKLRLPLVITRFTPTFLPLTRALPLIIQCSSSLEHIKLYANDSDADEYRIIPRHQGLSFPKLRHLAIEASGYAEPKYLGGFTQIVSWMMGASPNVDTFDIHFNLIVRTHELEDQILLENDFRNVTTLTLVGLSIQENTLEDIGGLSFSKLQSLTFAYMNNAGAAHDVLISIVARAAGTLRKLELLDRHLLDNADVVDNNFPVCPNVQELHLHLNRPNWSDFVSRCFPSLQDFGVHEPFPETFKDSPSFVGVKTLRLFVKSYSPEDFSPVELFRTFPGLDRLRIYESILLEYLRIRASSPKQSMDYLDSLKHLELEGSLKNLLERLIRAAGRSWFAELTGIETLAVEASLCDVIRMRVREMPSLEVLRIRWDRIFINVESLLRIANQVEKLVISNCCSVRRWGDDASSMKDLETFFNAAPNAVCGCKEQEMLKRYVE